MELHFHCPEFEEEVRTRLGVFHRPITEEDILSVTQLDLDSFDFSPGDMDTLSLFRNLKVLYINIGQTDPSFWHSFVNMEKLYVVCWGDSFDFSAFSEMKKLSALSVSGGDWSDMRFLHLESLVPLQRLRYLQLHEFGRVDLLPLASMPQLRELQLCYANDVLNMDVIGTLAQLEALTLDGLFVESLDFWDELPHSMYLEMCGNHVYNGVEPQKWKRFAKYDICEISVHDKPYAYIDLSVLDT